MALLWLLLLIVQHNSAHTHEPARVAALPGVHFSRSHSGCYLREDMWHSSDFSVASHFCKEQALQMKTCMSCDLHNREPHTAAHHRTELPHTGPPSTTHPAPRPPPLSPIHRDYPFHECQVHRPADPQIVSEEMCREHHILCSSRTIAEAKCNASQPPPKIAVAIAWSGSENRRKKPVRGHGCPEMNRSGRCTRPKPLSPLRNGTECASVYPPPPKKKGSTVRKEPGIPDCRLRGEWGEIDPNSSSVDRARRDRRVRDQCDEGVQKNQINRLTIGEKQTVDHARSRGMPSSTEFHSDR